MWGRGVSQRAIFGGRHDHRYFLSRLAWQVRAGRIEVIAYALLTNHYHLVLRSRAGQLAEVMQEVLAQHTRRFNRRNGRTGPLYERRYGSRRLLDADEMDIAVRYVEQNPVQARMAARVGEYPYASAFHQVRGRLPPWLSDAALQRMTSGRIEHRGGAGPAYAEYYGRVLPDEWRWLYEHNLWLPEREAMRAELARNSSPAMLEWLQERARNADGRLKLTALADPRVLLTVLGCADRVDGERDRAEGPASRAGAREVGRRLGSEAVTAAGPTWLAGSAAGSAATAGEPRGNARSPGPYCGSSEPALVAGLLRQGCGLAQGEIAARLGLSASRISELCTEHGARFRRDPGYAQRCAEILTACALVMRERLCHAGGT